MYDLSSEFEKFYKIEVVLPDTKQQELRSKRKLNVDRLKDGLTEINEADGTKYIIAEDRIQGSMAMHTIVQNDDNDFDIDVAIVFDKDNLNDMGPRATRNMVARALKKKTKQFAEEPEVKTSCVRLRYREGYHVDFAIFRRFKENENDSEYKYEHAGSEWSLRDIRGIENWFDDEIKKKGRTIRKQVRLSKMFCRSRDSWKNMPSGLVQTVLIDECLSTSDRLDLAFYESMKAIINRIDVSLLVFAPVDNNRALTTRESDKVRLLNWKNRLNAAMEDLDVLFSEDCTHDQAVSAWNKFFQHPFWSVDNKNASNVNELFSYAAGRNYRDTEEFIEDLYPVDLQYSVSINCMVAGKGFSARPIARYLGFMSKFIPHNWTITCSVASTNAPSYDQILWKVRNVGTYAEKRDDIRGQIQSRGNSITENSLFFGPHYIECYLIKKGVCIAIGHIDVPIGER